MWVTLWIIATLRNHTLRSRSGAPFSRIRFLLVPKNGSCEHIKIDLLSNGSVILKKTDGNRTCSIFIRHYSWMMKGTNKFSIIVSAPNWRFLVSSKKLITWTHYKWPADIFTTKTEPWNRTVWTPASSFWNQNRILKNELCEWALKATTT